MDDYSVSQWNAMVTLAEDIMKRPETYADKCRGKIMATLFYEPSTRYPDELPGGDDTPWRKRHRI